MKINFVEHNFKSLVYNNKPSRIVFHHAAASKCSVEDINRWHKNNGWSGIGYHYFVRKNGQVYKGRPENAQGAHCPNVNTTSIGVCFEGNFMNESMPTKQYNAGVELLIHLRAKYGNLPLSFHRELSATSCPGDNFPCQKFVETPTSNNKPTNTGNDIIRELQGYIGAKQDSIPGPETLSKCPLIKSRTQSNVAKSLQKLLIKANYSCGSSGADGDFWKNTESAVRRFQSAKGLSVDGIVGPKTWRKLLGL